MTALISNRVRELRVARGITQIELAQSIGMTRQTVAAIEQRHYLPSLEAAFRLSRALDCPLEMLFQWEGG